MSNLLTEYQVITVAIISVLGVMTTAYVAFTNNRKNILIQTITAERAKWRSEIRDYSADFIKLAVEQIYLFDSSRAAEMKKLEAHLVSRLNPDKKHKLDREILVSLNELNRELTSEFEFGVEAEGILLKLSKLRDNFQLLLKLEWEKSKKEAKTGKLH